MGTWEPAVPVPVNQEMRISDFMIDWLLSAAQRAAARSKIAKAIFSVYGS